MRQLEVGLTSLGLSWIPSIGNFITFDTGGDANGIFDRLFAAWCDRASDCSLWYAEPSTGICSTEVENQQFLDALSAVLKEIADGG